MGAVSEQRRDEGDQRGSSREREREGTKSWEPCRAACLQQISVLLDWAA